MTTQTKVMLKTYFEAGDMPTESQFADLIDSIGLMWLAANETQREMLLLSALEGDWCFQTATNKLYFCDGVAWVEVATLDAIVAGYRPLTEKSQAIFTVDGTLAAAAGAIRIRNRTGRTLTISEVYCEVDTAPTGAAIIVDVNKGGTTIFTNQAHRPQIAAGANTGSTSTIDVAAWGNDTYLTMDVDQIGSTVAGSNLTVTIIYS